MTFSEIAAGFVFGVFGVFLIKRGKDRGDVTEILIGLILLVYPYLVTSPLIVWPIGIALLYYAYRR